MAVSMLYSVYSFQKCQKIEKKTQIFLGKYTKTTDILLSWIKLCLLMYHTDINYDRIC